MMVKLYSVRIVEPALLFIIFPGLRCVVKAAGKWSENTNGFYLMISTIAEARKVIEKAGGKVKFWHVGWYAVTMPEDRDPYGYSPNFMSRIGVITFAENLAESFGTDGGPFLDNK